MPESARRTVFRNARLVDGTGAPPRAGIDVVLEGGRIASVGGSVAVGEAADLLIVDGDPVADIRILGDRDRLAGILKEGHWIRRAPALGGPLP
jgi:hypothetical protein